MDGPAQEKAQCMTTVNYNTPQCITLKDNATQTGRCIVFCAEVRSSTWCWCGMCSLYPCAQSRELKQQRSPPECRCHSAKPTITHFRHHFYCAILIMFCNWTRSFGQTRCSRNHCALLRSEVDRSRWVEGIGSKDEGRKNWVETSGWKEGWIRSKKVSSGEVGRKI